MILRVSDENKAPDATVTDEENFAKLRVRGAVHNGWMDHKEGLGDLVVTDLLVVY